MDQSTLDAALLRSGYGLTFAKFIYRMPDHQTVLNELSWQLYDVAPFFPKLHEFNAFWHKNIDGPLHSVIFSHRALVAPGEWRNAVKHEEIKFH